MENVIRFIAGGLIVSLFAMVGDALRPKSFAGLFGAAPSVALVSMTLAFAMRGADYVSIEARSMGLGAVALTLFCFLVCQLLMRARYSALTATLIASVVWLALSLALKQAFLG